MLKLIVACAGLVGSANAFWRMECQGRAALERVDPVVDPGEISKHVHAIHGSSAFTDTVDSATLLGGNCTSCRVTEDKSSYWHPALYFQHADTGKFELVTQVGGMLAYYFLFGDDTVPFPTDFRMLAGDTMRRNYTAGNPKQPDPPKSSWAADGDTTQAILRQRAIGFNCLNYNKAPEGTLYRHYMPDKEYLDANCADGIRIELMFPSCWKGEGHTDSPNHKDHVAYPSLVMTGDCPKGYETQLPGLMYEVIWNTTEFSGTNGKFVFANGDTTGFGYHGDFVFGWEGDTLKNAVKTCTNGSGRIEDCAEFTVVSEDEARSCRAETFPALAKEDVLGPMDKLPGNNPVYESGSSSGGGNDGGVSDAPKTSKAAVLTYAPGAKATNSANPLPGQVFKESKAVVPAVAPTSAAAPSAPSVPAPSAHMAKLAPTVPAESAKAATTSAAVVAEAASEPTDIYTTQFITNGNVVTEVLWEETTVYETDVAHKTLTVTMQPAQKRRRRAAHLHGHGHRHI